VGTAAANGSAISTGSDAEPALDPARLRRGFVLLAITSFAVTAGLNVFQAIQPNFFRDELGIGGALNGYWLAIREVPGFLLIFVAAVLLRLGIARAAAFSLVLMAVGFSAVATSQSFGGLIVPTLIASVGYHSWLQLQDALGLSLARPGEEGAVLGRFRAIGFAGTLVGLVGVLVTLLAVEWITGDLRANQGPWLRGGWVAVGLCAVVGAVAIARFPVTEGSRALARAAPRVTFRREYRLYYWLTFVDGSRMQIYFAFAPFVLVEEFNVNARALQVLLVTGALLNWRTGAWIGRLVDRHGERRMLTIGYCGHLAVFLGFAFAQNVWLLYLTYLGYTFLSLFSIGTTTYLRKICRPQDLAPSLAMGISLAHLTAIVVPVVGAALWERLGYQFPFLFGTVFIFASLWLAQRIDVERQRVADGPTWRGDDHDAERSAETAAADAPLAPVDAGRLPSTEGVMAGRSD